MNTIILPACPVDAPANLHGPSSNSPSTHHTKTQHQHTRPPHLPCPQQPSSPHQAVQAAQLTFEDFFMADLAMAPLKIVGFEGVFGTLMMVCVLLPAAYYLPGPEGYGLHENTPDTLEMIKNSKGLQVCLFG